MTVPSINTLEPSTAIFGDAETVVAVLPMPKAHVVAGLGYQSMPEEMPPIRVGVEPVRGLGTP